MQSSEVTVRFFAAVREAAGTAETTLPPGRLPELLTTLEERYGQRFADRLAISTVLVDGTATPHHAALDVPAGAELALLPPVSGGAGSRGRGCCGGGRPVRAA